MIPDFRPRLGNRCNNMVHSGYFCAAILDLRGSNWQSLQPLSSFRGLSCSDSRFQAQTWQSLQLRGSFRVFPCSDSRFQAQTWQSLPAQRSKQEQSLQPKGWSIVPRPGNAGWAGTSDGVAARGFVNVRGPPRSGGRESTAGAHRSEVPARRQTRSREHDPPR